jgi:hypothetical protein
MKKIAIVIVLFSILIYGKTTAQIKEPVKWIFTVKELPNAEALLVFDAQIQPKWHLYSQYFPDGGPIKLKFTFENSADYQTIGKVTESPNPKIEHDDIFEIDVQFFTGQASFSQKIKILSKKDFTVKGQIDGQACSDVDGTCVLVESEFNLKVKGVVGTKKGEQSINNTEKKN